MDTWTGHSHPVLKTFVSRCVISVASHCQTNLHTFKYQIYINTWTHHNTLYFAHSLLQHWDISQTKIRVISTLLFVLFGCLLFVALPAAIFKHIEGWSALESLYFVVITLTTIGFGDFVAGTNTKRVVERYTFLCMHRA